MTLRSHRRLFSRTLAALAMLVLLLPSHVMAFVAAAEGCRMTCCRGKKKSSFCRAAAKTGPSFSARVCPPGCGQVPGSASPVFTWNPPPVLPVATATHPIELPVLPLALLLFRPFALCARPPPPFAVLLP